MVLLVYNANMTQIHLPYHFGSSGMWQGKIKCAAAAVLVWLQLLFAKRGKQRISCILWRRSIEDAVALPIDSALTP